MGCTLDGLVFSINCKRLHVNATMICSTINTIAEVIITVVIQFLTEYLACIVRYSKTE